MASGDAQGGKKGSGDGEMKEPEWMVKKREFEKVKARAKALKLRLTCTICGEKAKLNCPCGTTQYCSVACQKVDWRERGHKKVCKEIRARAEAPTPPPSPPRDVVYGPAPRSHADEIRACIAAEHEAARARREANPEREPDSSYKKAVKIYKRAVELGSVQATIELGHMYENGRGVTLDLKKAKQLYRMAADRGHANAQFNVACALLMF
ncbi:hypothetical protein SO694_0001627 [Aureococcus anophagefferens]|uniref:MYND-type domain-containing protein n=1 Tax=Aureococcus anophagefferens TaxID=44056 RepID=A0ABR1G209_AURAN